MKILCYGDSNTWGFDREHNCRIQQRWTKVLQSLCAKDEIIEAVKVAEDSFEVVL